MIIKDVKGGQLELNNVILKEITGYVAEPYFVLLKDLRKKKFLVMAVRDSRISIPYDRQENGPNTIGCRTFSPATFAKILKAAGVKPVRKTDRKRKPAKKGKKS